MKREELRTIEWREPASNAYPYESIHEDDRGNKYCLKDGCFHRWCTDVYTNKKEKISVLFAVVENEDGEILLVGSDYVRFTDNDQTHNE